MKSILPLLCGLLLLSPNANSSGHEEVLKPIRSLFDGMREGNGDKVRNAFSAEALMYRAHDALRTGLTPEQFAQAVEGKGTQMWDEKIWDIEVQVDDKLASVWTKFVFYRNGEFSHCGVNSFQLYRYDEGWKIMFLADTNRKDRCGQIDKGV